jgi:hypothetical protein
VSHGTACAPVLPRACSTRARNSLARIPTPTPQQLAVQGRPLSSRDGRVRRVADRQAMLIGDVSRL